MEDNNENLDKFKWNYTKEIRKKLRIGSLILSQPFLDDAVFKRSVCLMCAHSRKEGAFGFIINKLTEYTLSDFIEALDGLETPIFFGGPVASNSLYYLHDNSLNLDGAQEINPGLFWGGDFEKLQAALVEDSSLAKEMKFILGYSGWDPGQLRKEIIEDSWIVTECKNEYAFSKSVELWKHIMSDMGDLYQHLSKLPESPNLN